MNARTVRERMRAAWEAVDDGDCRPMERLVMDVWHECRTAREKLEGQEAAYKTATAAGQREHAELQEKRIEIEALKQQLRSSETKAAQVPMLQAELDADPTIDVREIRMDILRSLLDTDQATVQKLNDGLRTELVAVALRLGRADIAEWASRLNQDQLVRVLHCGYSELAWWEFACGVIKTLDIQIDGVNDETEIMASDGARADIYRLSEILARRSGLRKGVIATAMAAMIANQKVVLEGGTLYRPSEIKRLPPSQGESHET